MVIEEPHMDLRMTDRELERILVVGRLIVQESDSQIAKWGVQCRHPFEWLCYLGEEVGELNKAMAEAVYREGSWEDVRDEAIQVATLSIKIAEMVLGGAPNGR